MIQNKPRPAFLIVEGGDSKYNAVYCTDDIDVVYEHLSSERHEKKGRVFVLDELTEIGDIKANYDIQTWTVDETISRNNK